jgi:hypothetical protein
MFRYLGTVEIIRVATGLSILDIQEAEYRPIIFNI